MKKLLLCAAITSLYATSAIADCADGVCEDYGVIEYLKVVENKDGLYHVVALRRNDATKFPNAFTGCDRTVAAILQSEDRPASNLLSAVYFSMGQDIPVRINTDADECVSDSDSTLIVRSILIGDKPTQ